MRLVVDGDQSRRIDIHIALRRRDRSVSKQLLDGPKIGTGVEQMRSEGVT